MTERLSINSATATSAAWSPTDDFAVQVQWPDPRPRLGLIDVQARADTAAPWVSIGGITVNDVPPIARFSRQAQVQLVLTGNDGGGTVKAWSDA